MIPYKAKKIINIVAANAVLKMAPRIIKLKPNEITKETKIKSASIFAALEDLMIDALLA